jgi:hypothetical protein
MGVEIRISASAAQRLVLIPWQIKRSGTHVSMLLLKHRANLGGGDLARLTKAPDRWTTSG